MFVNFFIQRPVFASVCALLIILAGAAVIPTLPIAQFPNLAPPQVGISSFYIGASAQTVESAVTIPLEQQINGAEGMKYVTSTSGNDGSSGIRVTFDLNRDPDIATVDNTGMHDVYDPATNSWKSAAPMPTPRSAMAVTLYRGLILVAGGECNNRKTFIENEGYDPKTDRWVSLASMATGRHGFRAVTLGDLAYFAGGAAGCGGGEISDTLLTFSLP